MNTTASTTALAAAPRAASGLWLHRFAGLVALCTFCLIVAGSMVTSTDAGLSVPDWPTTYGYNMFTFPPSKWVGGIFYEHVHRLIGAAVGLLTIMLCAWLWLSDKPRRIKWLGTAALVAVCAQGILGGLTVLNLLPTWISVAHAGLAEIFFCITVSLWIMTSPKWESCGASEIGRAKARGSLSAETCSRLRRLAAGVAVCIYAQILLGAVMRHTDSGLAILDFPLAYGSVLPPTSAGALESINIDRVWNLDLEAVTLSQVWIHFAHRLGALTAAVAVVLLVRHIISHFGRQKALVQTAVVLAGLLVVQFVLGAMTIWTQATLWITTVHVGGGALLLATSWVLVLRTWAETKSNDTLTRFGMDQQWRILNID